MATFTIDENGIAVLNMGNTENRFNIESVTRLHKVLDEIEKDESVNALIITASGKYFGNGLDLEWLINAGEEMYKTFWLLFNKLLARILIFPMPTIAAINGHAFAGACFLSLTTDIRVMNADKGWLSLNEVYMPSRIPVFLNQLIRHTTPSGNTRVELYGLGRRFTASDAKLAGLVQYTVPADQLILKAKQVALERLKYGPLPRHGCRELKIDLDKEILEKVDIFTFEEVSKIEAKL